MKFYTLGQLSQTEKNNIVNQHRQQYNGYRNVYGNIPNEQPLYVQDFANDKEGLTVNNKGEVKTYTNFGINEQQDMMAHFESELDEIKPEELVKGEKYKYKSPSFEDEVEYEDEVKYPVGISHHSFKGKKAGHLVSDKALDSFISKLKNTDEGIYDVEDLHKGEEFDYLGGDANLEEDHMDLYEPMESAFADDEIDEEGIVGLYNDVDPAYDFKSDGPMQLKGPYGASEQVSMEEDWEEIDEDLRESFKSKKNKINEMMNRMSKF